MQLMRNSVNNGKFGFWGWALIVLVSGLVLSLVIGAVFAYCEMWPGKAATSSTNASTAGVVEESLATNTVAASAGKTNIEVQLLTVLDLSGLANVPTNVVRKPSGRIRTSEIK